MSTPEEQQQYQQHQQHQQHQQEYAQQQDPYGTQTWQSDTWDTGYQPVPPPGGVPGQPFAPEGWFRDEAAPAPAPAQEWAAETAYLPPYADPAQPQPQQPVAPEGWYREEAPAPAPAPARPQAPAPAQDWSREPAAAQTAYLPPYPGPAAAEETAYLPPYPDPAQQQQQPQQLQQATPEGWFRDEVPAPAPAPHWSPEAPVPASAPASASVPVPVLPETPEEEPEYSPPTLAGNTVRAVDPAQARAEGRSPIIDPGPQSAILTAALGVLLAVAAALGQYALLLPLVALQGLTAAGWFRLNGMWPARQGIALAFAGAVVADVAVLAVDGVNGPGAIIGTLGAWVLLTLVLQLRSHADPDERMYGLMASVASAALAIICAGYLAADAAAVTVGAAAVAVAVFARALPLPTPASVGVSLAAAGGAGIAVGGLTDIGVGGALLGLAAGVCALIGLRVAAYDYPSKFVHMTAGVALPLAAAAPAVYLIGRVVS
ncbi:hypothetical protein ACFCZ1_29485 [Streptomyces sp. NPDC056224]|uniref:hypothetical protein n=1 Tax=Streptomyces sp. NPDC056224 TaxID=3345750 RepID=UPI0035E1EEA0